MTSESGAARGFTLFEFCIVTALVAAFSATLLERAAQVQRQAQDVAARQVLAAVETAFKARVAHAGDDKAALARLASQNPVTWLMQPPSNYRGEVGDINLGSLPDNSWVFDRRDKTLLYLPPGHKSLSFSRSSQLKFKVEFPHIKDSARQSVAVAQN